MHLRGSRNILVKLILRSLVYCKLLIFSSFFFLFLHLICFKVKEGYTSLRFSTALEIPGDFAGALYLFSFVSIKSA